MRIDSDLDNEVKPEYAFGGNDINLATFDQICGKGSMEVQAGPDFLAMFGSTSSLNMIKLVKAIEERRNNFVNKLNNGGTRQCTVMLSAHRWQLSLMMEGLHQIYDRSHFNQGTMTKMLLLDVTYPKILGNQPVYGKISFAFTQMDRYYISKPRQAFEGDHQEEEPQSDHYFSDADGGAAKDQQMKKSGSSKYVEEVKRVEQRFQS